MFSWEEVHGHYVACLSPGAPQHFLHHECLPQLAVPLSSSSYFLLCFSQFLCAFFHSFIHFCYAPLGVCKHQSSEWTILSRIDCFFQREVVLFQVLLDSLHPHSTRASTSCWSPPVLQRGKLLRSSWRLFHLAIWTLWLNREKRCAWTVAKRCGCLVVRLTSSFCTWWYQLIPNSFCKHHWSRVGLPRVPGYPTGTRVINYPGNFLLPPLPGYPNKNKSLQMC